jgi:hypothetical protein
MYDTEINVLAGGFVPCRAGPSVLSRIGALFYVHRSKYLCRSLLFNCVQSKVGVGT